MDYLYGLGVASSTRKRAKLFLWLSIVNNVGILAVFKYYDFFIIQFQQAFASIGISVDSLLLHIALPIGISFYTFHGMSYVFDIYRKQQSPVKSMVDYAAFVGFFPLLVAGPIERASHLLPQIQRIRKFSYNQAADGCRLILWGMFKKVVVADNLATIVDLAFNNYSTSSGLSLIVALISFSFQIYCDFSGYSDIAIGTAKLFGFELLSNFKFPYFSRDIAEYWRRWHISLTSWFKDYLYIPLGGSRNGKLKAIRNTFIVFLVSGLWHGANWTFIIWGFIHACAFLPLLLLNQNRAYVNNVVAYDKRLPNLKELYQMLSTFSFVTFAWVFFRADSPSSAIGYIKRILTSFYNTPFQSLSLGEYKAFFCMLIIIFSDWHFRRNERQLKIHKILIFIMSIIIIYFMLYNDADNNFIYFSF